MQSSASGRAANAARHQQEMAYRINEAKLQPYTEAGQLGWEQLNSLLGLRGPEAANAALTTFQQSPGYQWTMDQGLRAVDAGAAASGLARSGAALKAEQTFGQGLADQEFNNYVNNLFKVSGFGQKSALQEGVDTSNLANNLGSIGMNDAARQSNIYGDAAKGLGTAVNDLLGNKNFQNWINGPSTPSAYPSVYQPGGVNYGTDATSYPANTWF